jgi:hypothetical protein
MARYLLLVLHADGEPGAGSDCRRDRGVATLLTVGPIAGYQEHLAWLWADRGVATMDSGLDCDCDG